MPLPWPLPAFAAWALGWATFFALQVFDLSVSLSLALGVAVAGVFATTGATSWRRVFMGVGFPLSFAASGFAGAVPAWTWLVALAVLALIYPMNAWRDAPIFPTPRGALAGLGRTLALPDAASVLDAGCGLGDALVELRREYPRASLAGIERSWPLRALCAMRCRFARIRRADMWAADWSQCDLVYLFQRPESMQRAVDKASRDLRAGAWMASLEFEARDLRATQVFDCADGRSLWLYRAPFERAAQLPDDTP